MKFKNNLVRRKTYSEGQFLKLLWEVKKKHWTALDFKFQKSWIAGEGFYISDFYFPSNLTTVEIDGGYHQTPKQIKKDATKAAYLLNRGVSTVRITNEEVCKMKVAQMLDFLVKNGMISMPSRGLFSKKK